jgi:hypothetical protein
MATDAPQPPASERHSFLAFPAGLSLGLPLGYLFFAALGFLHVAGNWGSPSALFALMLIMFHERFWIPLRMRTRSARFYQFGTVLGFGLVALAWARWPVA